MISEPEMVGGFGDGHVMDLPAELEPHPPRAPRPRRPWVWALGGAVVASAVWGGALFAYGRGHDEGIDTKGYAVGDDLCRSAALTSLSAALGTAHDPYKWAKTADALDQAGCITNLGADGSDDSDEDRTPRVIYGVNIFVALHKVTDPAPEFEATRDTDQTNPDERPKVEEVPGLGDVAYMVTSLSSDPREPELRVRDGGAVLTLRVSVGSVGYDTAKEPKMPTAEEMAALQPAMIEDMRALMAALKK
ncbi:hypothetical protein [Streptomyces sp. NPDC050738]|uniref:hypothetical protein n=1 Tax=Streptomyces sp. NPDC050738 TaxID=3154744 RepID=UPI003418F1EF